MPACCPITSAGTTIRVCGCTSKVTLLSTVYPFVTCSPAFACRHWGSSGERRDGVAAESAPSVLCLMSRFQHLQPSSAPPFPTSSPTSLDQPPCLGRGTLLPTSQAVMGGLCLCHWGLSPNLWDTQGGGDWFDRLCQATNRRLWIFQVPCPVSKYLSAYFRRRMEFMSQCRSCCYFSIIPFSIPQSSLSFQLAVLHSLVLPVNRCSHRLPITGRLYTSQRLSLGAHLNKPIDLSF